MSFKRVPKLIIISVLSVSLLSLGFGSRFVSASSSLTWADQATMTTARTALAVVAAENGLIYAMGGNGSEFVDDQLSTVEAYNPTNNTWATKASMEHIRLAFGAVDYSGLIYVFGGQGAPSDPTALATAEVYTPSTNSWSYIASMPVALSGTQAVVSGGKIYVVGGRHADGSLAANVEQYDPATNTWAQKTSMPTARTEGALATDTSGNIYAIGGFVSDQLKTVQEYNPTTDSWTSRADMPTARGDLGATTVGGIIYAVGGYNRTSNALSVVESYDPSTNTWSTGTSLQHARSGLGVTSTASGDIYAIGGEPVPTPYPSNIVEKGTMTSLADNVTDYYGNNGSSYSRQSTPFTSGIATQTSNSDGSVTVAVNSAPGYADSGFTLYSGTLGDLPNFTVNGTGNYGLNLWFDSNNDNSFFQWDSNGVLTSLNGDTYGLGPSSSSGTLAVSGSSQFYMMSDGQNHSLSDLKSGSVSGISSSTKVTIWIGVNVGSGSTSATINSISGL